MSNLIVLVPVALALGGLGLLAFLWSIRAGQYDDLDGASRRILLDDAAGEDDPAEPPQAPRHVAASAPPPRASG